MSFWCTLCESLGVSSIAHVRKHQNGTTFTLEFYDQDHQCVPSTVQQLVFRFKKQLYQEVENNPLKSVNLIYQETRSEFTDKLDEDSLIIFLQDIPSLAMISPQEWQRSMSVDTFYGDNNVLLLAFFQESQVLLSQYI
jgi:hypothetical protein